MRADGTVKVLDFGLAKAMEPRRGSSPSAVDVADDHDAAMTQAGVILGTAAYMSPEQARGKPVDKRTDIWAFGCVLFEMLTGRRGVHRRDGLRHAGDGAEGEPDWTALPATTPAPIRSLLRRCLQRDPKQRLRDIADARFQIETALTRRRFRGTHTIWQHRYASALGKWQLCRCGRHGGRHLY